jgi:hypothetical protein
MTAKTGADKTQSEKFKKLAREIGADEDEAAFKAKLKKLAKAKPEKKEAPDN